MATLTSTLIVRLLDKVTAPAKGVANAIAGISRAADDAGGSLSGRIQGAMNRNNIALDQTRGQLLDAVGGFYLLKHALSAPLSAATQFESQLEDIGQKANIPIERLGALGGRIQGVARDTNQASTAIASAIDNLVGRGASEQIALAASKPIGRAATAYRAATDDLASASWSAVDNLKVPADHIETALDMMAQAGKEGAFELRDMAKYFPSLGAAYQALGQNGTDAVADLAAALQVVRKGTGDSSSAATNLNNVLQKIYVPATIKKFGEYGVDVFKEMEAAASRGLTPIEAIAELTEKTLDGDLRKLGSLFEDAQVQQGLRSIIQNMAEYRRIRDEALNASGVVQADYERRVKQAEGASLRWKAAIENVSIALGTSLLPIVADLSNKIVPLIDRIGAITQAHPALTRVVIGTTAGLIGMRIAMIGVRFAALMARGGLLSLALPVVRLGSWARNAAGGAVALQASLAAMSGAKFGGFAKVATAMGGIARAVPGIGFLAGMGKGIAVVVGALTAPAWGAVALGIGAVALAGAAINKYWDRLSAIISGVGRALSEQFAPAIDAIRPALDGLAPIAQSVGSAFGTIRDTVSSAIGSISALFEREILTPDGKAAFENAGYMAMNALLAGLKAAAGAVLEYVSSLGAKIAAKITSAVSGALGRVGSWVGLGGGDTRAPAIDGARARGGPVRRGGTYLVGEEGPELRTDLGNGRIIPHDETMRLLRKSSSGAISGGGGGQSLRPIEVNAPITIHGGGADAKEIARQVRWEIEQGIRAGMRGLHADVG